MFMYSYYLLKTEKKERNTSKHNFISSYEVYLVDNFSVF
jgi:hypothetical protein